MLNFGIEVETRYAGEGQCIPALASSAPKRRCVLASAALIALALTVYSILPAARAQELAQSGAATDMPYYDPEASCDEVANVDGTFSETVMRGCLDVEQKAYNELKSYWDTLPADMRKGCDEVARVNGEGSYSVLRGCIDEELRAERDNERFHFQR